MSIIFHVRGVIICEPQEPAECGDGGGHFPLFQGQQFSRRRAPVSAPQNVATELDFLHKKLAFFSVGHQVESGQFIKHTPHVGVVSLQGRFLTPLPLGADDDIVDIRVGDISHLLQAMFNHPLKNCNAIFQSHHHDTPLFCALWCTAARVGPRIRV